MNSLTDLIQSSLIPTRQSTSIEIQLGSGYGQNQSIAFGNQNTLLDKCLVTSLETYYDTILSQAPSGNPLITLADLSKLTLDLCDDTQGQQFYWLKQYPLYPLVTSLNAGIQKQVFWRPITLNKCNLNVVDTSVTADVSVVLTVNYWTVDQFVLLCKQMGFNLDAQAMLKRFGGTKQ